MRNKKASTTRNIFILNYNIIAYICKRLARHILYMVLFYLMEEQNAKTYK
jgi:hypothetical protein